MITHILVSRFKTFDSKQKTQEAQKDEKLIFPGQEAVARKCPVKRIFLGISQDSRGSACARVSYLTKLQASGLQLC